MINKEGQIITVKPENKSKQLHLFSKVGITQQRFRKTQFITLQEKL